MQITKQRFENLEIWKISIEIAREFCCIAEELENQQMDKFLDYMKDICMRLSNRIAEVSNYGSKQNVICSLTKAHLLTLEVENIIMILYEQQLIELSVKQSLLKKIQMLDDMILEYQQQSEEKFMVNNN